MYEVLLNTSNGPLWDKVIRWERTSNSLFAHTERGYRKRVSEWHPLKKDGKPVRRSEIR